MKNATLILLPAYKDSYFLNFLIYLLFCLLQNSMFEHRSHGDAGRQHDQVLSYYHLIPRVAIWR